MTRDLSEYEDQEWPLDDDGQTEIEYEFLNGGTMKYLVQDPETETIMAFIAPEMADGEDKTQSERQFDLCRDSIVAPELTMEKWRDMRTADQIGLTNKVSEAIGLDRILGNAVGSRDQLPDELLPE